MTPVTFQLFNLSAIQRETTMALDINGYNTTFNTYVKFADDSMRMDGKAIAQIADAMM